MGVKEAMLSFLPEELHQNPDVIKRLNRMETLLAAGGSLDWYMPTWGLQQLRNQGKYRELPQSHFPLVEREDWEKGEEGRVAPVPRRGLLAPEAVQELVAACKRGDAVKAGHILGARKVGSSAKSIILNMGYKGLGVQAAKIFAKALTIRGLEVLELDVSGNGIGSEGAEAIAKSLPESLKVLKLNVSNNRLGLPGVKAIAASLPENLEVLSLGFAGIKTGTAGALALAEALPQTVRELTLDLYGNGIGDDGVAALAKALPETIEYLNVVLLQNSLSRRGLFALDRQIGDPLHERYLPNLTQDNFKKAAKLEIFEFAEAPDGTISRQLDLHALF
eukprot:TRINITY_DN30654_c0_g1_i1.p1 TRINITY_DN30654_c0_g1~~TRINITY_DN30654_c0_g1_i1.p1  ORF type:complete len:334 (+),score=57.91 TRINITY_DN30654_c0_g1_i1:229-1230(+)